MQAGQRFRLQGLDWRVLYVNASRAHCEATTTRTVTVLDKRTGQPRTFTAKDGRTMDISPNTDLGLLREWQL